MPLPATRGGRPGQQDLARERPLETDRATIGGFVQDTEFGHALDHVEQGQLHDPGDRRPEMQLDTVPERGRHRQQPLGDRAERCELAIDQLPGQLRHLDGGEITDGPGTDLVGFARDESGGLVRRQIFDECKGVTLRARAEFGHHARRIGGGQGIACLKQFLYRLIVERWQGEAQRLALPRQEGQEPVQLMLARHQVGTVGHDQEERRADQAAHQHAQHFERAAIGPLQIIDEEAAWSRAVRHQIVVRPFVTQARTGTLVVALVPRVLRSGGSRRLARLGRKFAPEAIGGTGGPLVTSRTGDRDTERRDVDGQLLDQRGLAARLLPGEQDQLPATTLQSAGGLPDFLELALSSDKARRICSPQARAGEGDHGSRFSPMTTIGSRDTRGQPTGSAYPPAAPARRRLQGTLQSIDPHKVARIGLCMPLYA